MLCPTGKETRKTKVRAVLEVSAMEGNSLGEIRPGDDSRKFMTCAVQKDKKVQVFPPPLEVTFVSGQELLASFVLRTHVEAITYDHL